MRVKLYNDDVVTLVTTNDVLVDLDFKVYEVFCENLCSNSGKIYRLDDVIKRSLKIYSKGMLRFERVYLQQPFKVLTKRDHDEVSD